MACRFLTFLHSNLFVQEYQTVEKALRAERDQFRDQLNATKNEVENLRGICGHSVLRQNSCGEF